MLFSETGVKLENLVKVNRVVTETSNIAGVAIPVFKQIGHSVGLDSTQRRRGSTQRLPC